MLLFKNDSEILLQTIESHDHRDGHHSLCDFGVQGAQELPVPSVYIDDLTPTVHVLPPHRIVAMIIQPISDKIKVRDEKICEVDGYMVGAKRSEFGALVEVWGVEAVDKVSRQVDATVSGWLDHLKLGKSCIKLD